MSKREEVAEAIIRKLKNTYVNSIGWEWQERNYNSSYVSVNDKTDDALLADVRAAEKAVTEAVATQIKKAKCDGHKYDFYNENITITIPINDAVKAAVKTRTDATKAREKYHSTINAKLAEIGGQKTTILDELVLGSKYDDIIAAMAAKLNLKLPE